jgi:hypothetical protein
MRRVIVAGVIATLALASFAGPAAAVPPDPPATPPDSVQEFPAEVVCDFAVRLEAWSNERVTEGADRLGNPRTVITGNAIGRLTNVDDPASLVVVTAGRVQITDPGDDTLRFEVSGRTLFYFLPQDVNPLGGHGGLFLVTGHAQQVLDLSVDAVTEFTYGGTVRDLCAELS